MFEHIEETDSLTRDEAINLVKSMKDKGGVLYYFNGNTYSVYFQERIFQIDTANVEGLNEVVMHTRDWTENYIKNTAPKEWGDIDVAV